MNGDSIKKFYFHHNVVVPSEKPASLWNTDSSENETEKTNSAYSVEAKNYKLKKNFTKPFKFKKMKFDMEMIDEQFLKKKLLKNEMKNKICICLANTRYEAIRRVSKQLGYKIVKEHDFWNICWTDSILGVDLCKDMRRFQKINHFPGMFEICRKDLLARNMNRMLKLYPLDYQIFPKTWCFPADLGDAIAYSKLHRNKTYIIKPDQGAQGRGIWITKSLKDIKPTERMICQLYINRPLLIDGFKFDLRVYTLITSTDPLRVYVFKEGLARFATSKYNEPSGYNTTNMYMHLTNYSVNKHSRTYSMDDECGSKRKFSAINKILTDEGHDVGELWENIDDIINKTILSAYPMLKHNYSACFPSHDIMQACFEILGIDILIDQNLKPFLLEVNHSPSFHTDEPIDREVKDALLKDAFNMLHISVNDKRKVLDEDKKRVKTRLLQKIRDHAKDEQKPSSLKLLNEVETSETKTNKLWTAQFAWEDSHCGGYRRIMPPKYGDLNRYNTLLQMTINQASVYSDTAASKRREECVRQQRKKLADRLLQQQLLMSKQRISTNLKPEGEEKLKIKKKRQPEVVNHYDDPRISESEEKERLHLMAQRDWLISNCGLVQNIISCFFHNNLLTMSDKRKYKDALTKLTLDVEKKQNQSINDFTGITNEDSNYKKKSKFNKSDRLGIKCLEAPINILPPIPCEGSYNSNYRTNKAQLARKVSNVIKIHNLDNYNTYSDNT